MGLDNSNGSSSRNRNNSYNQAMKASPRLLSALGSKSYSQLKEGSRGTRASLERIHTKKPTAVFPVSDIKAANLERKSSSSIRNNSYKAKEVYPRVLSASKSINSYNQLKDGLTGSRASLERIHTKKPAAALPVSEIKAANLEKKFSSSIRNNSYNKAKEVSPRVLSASKSTNSYNQLKDCLRGSQANLKRIHTKKPAAVFPVSKIKTVNLEKKFDFSEGLPLSSDYRSPSVLKSYSSQDPSDLDSSDIHLEDQFHSVLSLSGTYYKVPLFDGSRVSPIYEASLVLDKKHDDTGGKHFQEKVNSWLDNMDENEVTDSNLACLESGDSSYPTSLFENSSVFGSSSASLTTYDSSPSFAQGFDRTDTWDSLLNLEGSNSKLIRNREHGFDTMDMDFPSPSFSDSRSFLMKYPDFGSVRSVQTQETMRTLESNVAEEPLFWPFDNNLYRSPELDNNFLCISPRKNATSLGIHQAKPKLTRSRFIEKRSTSIPSKNLQSCRKALFSSKPEKPAADSTNKVSNNKVVKKITRPSGLSKSIQVLEKHPHNISVNRRSLPSKAKKPENRDKHDWISKRLLELEGSHVPSLVLERHPIEKHIGLYEFDGHEGLNREFNADEFNLPGSPCMKTSLFREIQMEVGQSGLDDQQWIPVKFSRELSTLHFNHPIRRNSH